MGSGLHVCQSTTDLGRDGCRTPKNLAEHEEIQAVEVVKGKKFAALVHIPIEPPFHEGDKYAKGRKVIRIDVDKQGKYWILYIANG